MQQLNVNTLELPWDKMGLKSDDVISVNGGRKYKVLSVSPSDGVEVSECDDTRYLVDQRRGQLSSDYLNRRTVRIVKKCSS
jgi:hypothetical protein